MESTTISTTIPQNLEQSLSPANLLYHWQAHRRLTRRVIESFPENAFFNHSVGGMLPFAGMVKEMLGTAVPGIWGILTGEWEAIGKLLHGCKQFGPASKEQLLWQWDEATELIQTLWPQVPLHRFQETDKAFNEQELPVYKIILRWIDSEIIYRGQAYVYLGSLGIELPSFEEG